jgi:hypothetical protein
MSETIPEPQELSPPQEAPRNLRFKDSLPDWGLRVIIFIAFLYFSTGKFKADPKAPWTVLFDQIGFGQWLRYVAAAFEMAGAFLVLFSRTVEAGLVLLATIMFAAMLIALLVLHRPSDAFVPFAILCGLIALGLHRRRV